MADRKITDHTAVTVFAPGDLIEVVDVSDTTDGAGGTNKKMSLTAFGSKFHVETITLPISPNPGEFDFATIPTGGKRLIIQGRPKSTAATGNDVLYGILNADTTAANYQSQQTGADNGGALVSTVNNPRVGCVSDTGSLSSSNGFFEMVIEDYDGAARKTMVTRTMNPVSSGRIRGETVYTYSAITAAITRVRIRTDNHSTDTLTGTLSLYVEF